MSKDILLEEVRKVELAVNLAEQDGCIDCSLADDVWYLIDCIKKLVEPEVLSQKMADEQKFYVLDKEDATLLKKTSREGVTKAIGLNIYNAKSCKDEEKYQLTEQEIKDYDKRFWPFAVKVEELEENVKNQPKRI